MLFAEINRHEFFTIIDDLGNAEFMKENEHIVFCIKSEHPTYLAGKHNFMLDDIECIPDNELCNYF